VVRPDADLLYLRTQQEIAELQRYRDAVVCWNEEIYRTVVMLQALWSDTSGLDWEPADHVLRQMLGRFSPEVVGEAILDVAPKVANGYLRENHWLPYFWTVAKNLAVAAGDTAGAEAADG
jgi:hypothetical protein